MPVTAYTPFMANASRRSNSRLAIPVASKIRSNVPSLIDGMIRRDLTSVEVMAADQIQPPRPRRADVHDVKTPDLATTQAQRQCRQQADRPQSGDQTPLPGQPIERRRRVRQTRQLQVDGFGDRLFGRLKTAQRARPPPPTLAPPVQCTVRGRRRIPLWYPSSAQMPRSA